MHMDRRRKIFLGKAAAVAAAIPFLLYAYEYGPPGGAAGVPGEQTCIQIGCHTGTVNSFGGNVSVTFPGGLTYTPGVKQHLVVTVTDSAQKRFGFQLTARLASSSTTQAGAFTPGADGYTQLVCGFDLASVPPQTSCPALEYIEHTLKSYQASPVVSSFEFDWTPPSTNVGNIVIYVAGNAVNGDLQPTGDHVYTANYTLTPAAAGATPTITDPNGVVNGAGFQSTIQSGSWVTIFGSNLATNTRTWTDKDFVNGQAPTSLDGTSVSINGKPAFVYYISPTQLNVQAPTDSSTGTVNVQVTVSGSGSNTVSANMQAFSPAFFMFQANNNNYAIAQRNPDYTLIGPSGVPNTVKAKPGDVIILWGTGFGATNPAVPAGQPVTGAPQVTTAPTITIGGVTAQYISAVLSPGAVGLYQVAVTVPSGVTGDVPVVASVSGAQSPANVFLAVQ